MVFFHYCYIFCFNYINFDISHGKSASNSKNNCKSLLFNIQYCTNHSLRDVQIYTERLILTLIKHQRQRTFPRCRSGDILLRLNGEYIIVEMVQHEILESPVKVYNFEVADFHTYFVGDDEVLVHNSC